MEEDTSSGDENVTRMDDKSKPEKLENLEDLSSSSGDAEEINKDDKSKRKDSQKTVYLASKLKSSGDAKVKSVEDKHKQEELEDSEDFSSESDYLEHEKCLNMMKLFGYLDPEPFIGDIKDGELEEQEKLLKHAGLTSQSDNLEDDEFLETVELLKNVLRKSWMHKRTEGRYINYILRIMARIESDLFLEEKSDYYKSMEFMRLCGMLQEMHYFLCELGCNVREKGVKEQREIIEEFLQMMRFLCLLKMNLRIRAKEGRLSFVRLKDKLLYLEHFLQEKKLPSETEMSTDARDAEEFLNTANLLKEILSKSWIYKRKQGKAIEEFIEMMVKRKSIIFPMYRQNYVEGMWICGIFSEIHHFLCRLRRGVGEDDIKELSEVIDDFLQTLLCLGIPISKTRLSVGGTKEEVLKYQEEIASLEICLREMVSDKANERVKLQDMTLFRKKLRDLWSTRPTKESIVVFRQELFDLQQRRRDLESGDSSDSENVETKSDDSSSDNVKETDETTEQAFCDFQNELFDFEMKLRSLGSFETAEEEIWELQVQLFLAEEKFHRWESDETEKTINGIRKEFLALKNRHRDLGDDESSKKKIYEFQKKLSRIESSLPFSRFDETEEEAVFKLQNQLLNFKKKLSDAVCHEAVKQAIFQLRKLLFLLKRKPRYQNLNKTYATIIKRFQGRLKRLQEEILSSIKTMKQESKELQKEVVSSKSKIPVKSSEEYGRMRIGSIFYPKTHHLKEKILSLESGDSSNSENSETTSSDNSSDNVKEFDDSSDAENVETTSNDSSSDNVKEHDGSSDNSVKADDLESSYSLSKDLKEKLSADFQSYIERFIPRQDILPICIRKTNKDLRNLHLSAFIRRDERIHTAASLANVFRNFEKWYPFRAKCIAVFANNSCILDRIRTWALKIRFATASLCFLSGIGVLLTNSSGLHWKRIFIFAASGFSFTGILSTFLEKSLSTLYLEESVNALSHDEKLYSELIRSVYMESATYKTLKVRIPSSIDWELVMHIRRYFDYEFKKLPLSNILFTKLKNNYAMECSTIIYFSLLMASSSKNIYILDDTHALKEMFGFSASREGIIFWECMLLRQLPNFWEKLILSLDMFPKRGTLVFQAFPVILFSLHRFHPSVTACGLFFCFLTIFDAFKDLYRGVASKQISTMRNLLVTMTNERQQLEDMFFYWHL